MTESTDTHSQTHPTAHGGPGKVPVMLGDAILARGWITQKQLDHALSTQDSSKQKDLLGKLLVRLGYVEAHQVAEVMAGLMNVPFTRVTPEMVDQTLLNSIPQEVIDKYNVIPLSKEGDTLTLAAEDFTNVFLIEEISRLTNCKVKIIAAVGQEICDAREIRGATKKNEAIASLSSEFEDASPVALVKETEEDLTDLAQAASDSPVISAVNSIILGGVNDGASDIHIEPGDRTSRVRYRIDGELAEMLTPPFDLLPAIISRIKIMSGMDVAERRLPQDGSLVVVIEGRQVELRVSTVPSKFGEKAVLRIIDKARVPTSLDSLGIQPDMLLDLRRLIYEPHGIILVTGPTGSGKSTSLYGSLAEIVNDRVNVSTVEDPVEFTLPGVVQIQVNLKAGLTFARALRALLRQDPDILMVGEIRDSETAEIAIQAALTGHLVLSTLHTNDAVSAVTRLINMGVEPYLVAACVRGILAQRLVRKICTGCKKSRPSSPEDKQIYAQLFGDQITLDEMYAGEGCGKCRGTGFSGRIGIYELLLPTPQFMEAVAKGASLQDLRTISADIKYTTLLDDALSKVKAGIIAPGALLEIASQRQDENKPKNPKDVEEAA